MPELADVEVARRRLESWLAGTTITRARSADARILRPGSPAAFSRALAGRSVREVSRRGKWLRLLLSDGARMFSHLGMTGWWVQRECGSPKERSERGRIDVERRGRCVSVRYLDSRRFGRLVVSKEDIPEWLALGPDPLGDGVEPDQLAKRLGRNRRPIKSALMDQAVLAGVGNILATEALFRARIDPRSPSGALSRADIGTLVRALRATIERDLARKTSSGPSERGCEDEADGDFLVYGRQGAPCPRCGRPLDRVVLGGRGTTFCGHCQILRTRKRSSATEHGNSATARIPRAR
jgi:formamidopyrimidine-DNA glycosylase